MKLQHSLTPHLNRVTGYGEGYLMVNAVRIEKNIVLTPESLSEDWPPFESLAESHFESVLGLKPEVLILGTGKKQRFPHPRLYQSLIRHNIGIEIMDTAAACRTYNILMEEGRNVAAALILA